MNEKDFLEQIKKSADTIAPPDSLKPEEIENALKKEASKTTQSGSSQRNLSRIYRLGGLAAVFVLAFVGLWTARSSSISGSKQADASAIEAENSALTLTESADETAAPALAGNATVTEAAAPALAENATVTSEADAPSGIPGADSYETIYRALYDAFYYYGDDTVYAMEDGVLYETQSKADLDYAVEEDADVLEDYASANGLAAADTGSITSASRAVSEDDLSYSTTNVQEFGVDEGDIVKTDGKCLYILKKSGSVMIVSAKAGELKLTASLPFSFQDSLQELYVDGNRLSVIATGYYTTLNDTDGVYSSVSKSRTNLYTYDISDPADPELIGTVSQDGSYSQSRKNGDYIYLFSRYAPNIQDTFEASRIVPETSRGQLEASEIYLPEHLNYSNYLVASSVSIKEPDTVIDQKAVVSVASTFYASQQNIYIANEDWNGNETRTELIKLHYEDGTILGTAAGSVKGYLNNSFSLNESKGYLRVVSTYYDENYEDRNGLYVLDENLNTVGLIQDLAPNETIRSARFFGDIGYFVTFRQTDPLFSVDLSDPANPQILGELKVSGFSSYLHFYGENLLLGMGYEADENTGIRTGLKLSMFDISDPSDVKEVHRLVLNGITWCNSMEDYKSILIDPEKNLFGFTCDSRYLLFSYDPERGFVKEFIYDFYTDLISESLLAEQNTSPAETSDEETETESGRLDADGDTIAIDTFQNFFGYYDSSSDDDVTRGLYINDTLYLVRPGMVTSFDMENAYREIGRLALN